MCIIICFSFAACGRKTTATEKTFFVMDAALTVRVYTDRNAKTEEIFTRVFDLVTELDAALSRTVETGDIARINRERSAGDLSPHTLAVLSIASEMTEETGGAYLPTMGAITDLWKKAGEENLLPDATLLENAAAEARKGFSLTDGVCTIHGVGALLDLGGIGKGYAVDLVCALLAESGVTGALVSFGSSVATVGEKGDGTPFVISLRHPRKSDAVFGKLTAPLGVLSVSGDYERYVTVEGVRYAHILDPATGYPAGGISSVSVLAGDGARADALSTAFFVMGKEKTRAYLIEHPAVQAVLYGADGEIFITDGLSTVFAKTSD